MTSCPSPVAVAYCSILLSVGAGCGDGAAIADGGPLDTGFDVGGYDAALPPPPPSEPGRHDVEILETGRVVPGDGLPPETPAMNSNNNLDVVRHDGRVYLAWRTSPDHFAGPETVIHVVSSVDETTWTHEASFTIGTDLREPRFLSLGGSLFLYISVLGVDRFRFEPMRVLVTERTAAGDWSELEPVAGLEGFIAWRTRIERGVPYMTAYDGGEHIYLFDGVPLDVHLLTTADGRAWVPVDPGRPIVYSGGGSETDFTIADDGSLFGVIRNEAGDASGFGMELCRAPAGDLARWSCHIDPKKYDSPLMFFHDGEVYLIGRRNMTESGDFDLMRTRGTMMDRAIQYGIDYALRPKRCSLWRWVQGEDRIAFILDLPSNGDTCFPARIDGDRPGEMVVYNYSSDVDAEPIPWNEGQRGPTFIYRHVLRFTPR